MSADLAVLGASIRTLDPQRPFASAVAVRDGSIVAVGSDDEIRRECDARTEVLDGRSLALVPGLVDAHIHPFKPEWVAGADLTRCGTLADLEAELARERERTEGDWVLGWGLDYGVFHGREIEGRSLDDAVAGGPAMVTFMDQHTALATPRALELAGVAGAVRFDEGAEVVVREGRPTGELRENAAMDLVRRVLPPVSERARYEAVVRVIGRLNEVGITGVHAMDGTEGTLDLMRELEASGDLTLRSVIPFTQTPETPFEEMERLVTLRDGHGSLWRGGVAKFFIDGVVDTGTGWLYEPDTEGDGTEPFWPDPERYAQAVALFAGAGFQCVTHATGDRGVRAALDAYLAADSPSRALHRVEHVETLQDSDLPRFASEGVAASMQPLHMQWRRGDQTDSWAARLGPERTARAWRTRDLLAGGTLVPLGSDWPVAQYDPRIGLAWARVRRTPGDPDAPVFEPEQRLTGLESLDGYTVAAARVLGEDHLSGRIARGFRADLTAFAEDPVEVEADELIDLPVTLTIVAGKIVHRTS